jgi:hypothetical protein
MDVVITRAKTRPAWNLTDLFGHPIGCLTEEAGPWFIIEPNERTGSIMANVRRGRTYRSIRPCARSRNTRL